MQRPERNSVLENGIGCVAVLSGGSAARRATRSFTGSLWMTLSSSRSPILQLRLSLNPLATKNRLRRQGVGVTPVPTSGTMPRWKASSRHSKRKGQLARSTEPETMQRRTCSITSSASTIPSVGIRQRAISPDGGGISLTRCPKSRQQAKDRNLSLCGRGSLYSVFLILRGGERSIGHFNHQIVFDFGANGLIFGDD